VLLPFGKFFLDFERSEGGRVVGYKMAERVTPPHSHWEVFLGLNSYW